MTTDATIPDDAVLQAAVADVRELVAADGGDVVIDAIDGTTVQLRLILEGSECRECVMARAFLEQVALDVMRPTVSALTAIRIIDPREVG